MKLLSDLNSNSTLTDFIEFYEGIPEEKWCTGWYNGPEGTHCAIGFLMLNQSAADAISDIEIKNNVLITRVNDGLNEDFQQPTPKQRVIALLKSLL